MRFDIITIFPEIFETVFSGGVVKKAIDKGLIEIKVHNLRNFAHDRHRQVDDRPFGGKEGMVMKAEPIFAAVESIREGKEDVPVYLLSAQGKKFDHRMARQMATFARIILICGRYEGVDERVSEYLATEEVSIGDYILTGGEPAAAVIVDAVSRFIPGVVGKMNSVLHESFINSLLDFPQYTRPRDFRGMKVPAVLFSGDHKKIDLWRRAKALEKTWKKRPDLLETAELSAEDKAIVDIIKKKGKDDE